MKTETQINACWCLFLWYTVKIKSLLWKCLSSKICSGLTEVLMEGVCIGSYHHGHFLQRISSPFELGPVDPVLVTAAVMPTTVPDTVQVGVSTGVIPPTSLLVVGAVTWRHKRLNQTSWDTSNLLFCLLKKSGQGWSFVRPTINYTAVFIKFL